MALNYAYRTKQNTSVECVVYGEKNHETREMQIYDTTALFYMDSIVNKLAEHGASDPEKAIRIMLGLEDTEEAEDE
jgi:cystathionine beta-lyase/cystathionine gamma-synthase